MHHVLEKIKSTQAVTIYFLAALMVFAAFFAFFMYSQNSLRLDEAQSLWQTHYSAPKIIETVGRDVHVPLYHVLLHFWEVAFGNEVAVARTFSLLFFLFSIPAIFSLGKMVYGQATGLFSALLLAISPFMHWYGSEVRMYTLLTFLAILSNYFYLSILKQPSKSVWIGYGVTAVLGLFVHYFFALLLITQAVFFFGNMQLFPKKALRNFLLIGMGTASLFGAWFGYVFTLAEITNTTPALFAPTAVDMFNTLSEFFIGFQENALVALVVSLWPITVLFGFWALRKIEYIRPETTYLFLSVGIPLLLAFSISVLVQPIFLARYFIFVIPAVYILFSRLMAIYPPVLAAPFRLAVVALMLSMLSIQTINPNTPLKEDYRSAVQYLHMYANPQDVIIVSTPFTIYPIEYYYDGSAALATIPQWNRNVTGPIPAFSADTMPQEIQELAAHRETIWLVFSYDEGYHQDIKDYMDANYEQQFHRAIATNIELYAYGVPSSESSSLSAFAE